MDKSQVLERFSQMRGSIALPTRRGFIAAAGAAALARAAAGTACARKTAEGGAKVVMLESQAEDSFMAKGNDVGHINSKWQTETIGIPEYSPADFTSEYQICCANRA